jgi:hypothetical protein
VSRRSPPDNQTCPPRNNEEAGRLQQLLVCCYVGGVRRGEVWRERERRGGCVAVRERGAKRLRLNDGVWLAQGDGDDDAVLAGAGSHGAPARPRIRRPRAVPRRAARPVYTAMQKSRIVTLENSGESARGEEGEQIPRITEYERVPHTPRESTRFSKILTRFRTSFLQKMMYMCSYTRSTNPCE